MPLTLHVDLVQSDIASAIEILRHDMTPSVKEIVATVGRTDRALQGTMQALYLQPYKTST